MAISKIILNGVTQMDVTQDTVASSNLLSGFTATKNDGTKISGSYIPASPSLQDKTVTPTTSQQTVNADSGYDGLDTVTVNAIPSEYIIPTGNKAITSYGNNIDVAQYATASVSRATVTIGTTIIGTNANIASNASNNTLTLSKSSTNVRVDSDGGFFEQGSRTVSSDVQLTAFCNINNSDSLTVSGATVTAPSGYYSASASKSVSSMSLPTTTESGQSGANIATITPSTSNQYIVLKTGYNSTYGSYKIEAMPSGTAGTPIATKGTVSNHSVSVTPSVTNTTGYITGGTVNGTAVSVSASELVSGTLSVTSAGTKDVTNYASASIPSGTEGTPTAAKGTVSNHSVSVTPSVTNTNGFISGGTKTGTAVTVSASELVSGSETKTANGTYDVTNLASLVVNVPSGEDGDDLYYGSVDLTGTSWTFDNAPANLPEEETEFLHINLTAKNLNSSRLNSYNSLDFVDNQSDTMIIYGGTIAYDAGTWYEDKTINITGGTDATSKELYNILKANATQTT